MALTQVNSEGIKDGEVKNADMADDAVGVAELSATGTASNTTFLRGDNSWQTVSTTTEGEAVLSTTNSNEANTKFLRADGDGTCSWQTPPDTNTTYSVQDGQLSQNNFTDADHTKLDGIATGATVGAALTGSTNNTITTVTGANAIQGEANLTYDGSTLINNSDADDVFRLNTSASNGPHMRFQQGGTTKHYAGCGGGISLGDKDDFSIRANDNLFLASGNTSTARLAIDSSGKVGIGLSNPASYYSNNLVVQAAANEGGITIAAAATTHNNYIMFADGTSGTDRYSGLIGYQHTANIMELSAGGGSTGNFKVKGDGNCQISNGNLIVADGHGIDFSATANAPNTGAAMNSEVLDFYEEGSWTPKMQYHSGGGWNDVVFSDSPDQTTAIYTRVGDLCWFSWYSGGWTATSYSGTARIIGLPFDATSNNNGYAAVTFTHADCFTADVNSGYVQRSGNEIYPVIEDATTVAIWENGTYLMVAGVYKCA